MKFAFAIASCSALIWSSAASAAESQCVSRQQIAAMATVFVPVGLRTSRERCGAMLPQGAYLRSAESEARLARANADAVGAEKLAMDGFKIVAGNDVPDGVSEKTMLTLMSEMAVAELNKKLDASTCVAMNDIFQSTRSMTGPEVGTFLGAMFALVIGGQKQKHPICKV